MSQLDFAIIGAQKSGTTALSQFLDQHPDIAMARPKETHLFDVVDGKPDSDPGHIDKLYAAFFEGAREGQLRGEATPIYLYWPETLTSIHAYEPDLKLIVLLRNPVDRAISHYEMEKQRGNEPQSLFRALMLERRRLNEDQNPRLMPSTTRFHSYRDRGFYSEQLAHLYRLFPKNQVLVLHMQDLLTRHNETLAQVFRFLQVDDTIRVPHEVVLSSAHVPLERHRLCRVILKSSYLLEYWRIRKYIDFPVTSWIW